MTRRRPPITLWLSLSGELLRLVAVSAGALVVALAFAVAVKPLADGKLGPEQTLRFMLLAIPPMMQFALPFAAGFGATLTYHRFAADNEALAAHAAGISHRALLAPALAVGAALALLLAALSHQVIPLFLQSMQKIIAHDVTRFFVTAIESGQSVRQGGLIIHADEIDRLGPHAPTGASERLLLQGVVAVRTDDQGRLLDEATARQAVALVFAPETAASGGWVYLRLLDAAGRRAGVGAWEQETAEFRLAAPGGFRDDPKFYTSTGMRELRDNPERVPDVDFRRRELARVLEEARVRDAVTASINADQRLALLDDEGRWVVVAAGAVRGDEGRWTLSPRREGGRIDVTRRLSAQGARIQSAQRATLVVDELPGAVPGSTNPAASLSLELEMVATQDTDAPSGGAARERLTIAPLFLPDDGTPTPSALPVAALLQRADEQADLDPRVAPAADALREALRDLSREILSKEQERLAVSASCMIMVLGGAVVGMRLRNSRPLHVYAWSFFPSLIALITIAGGQRTTHADGPVGLLLLWGGAAGLALFVLAEYAALRRR